LRVSAARETTRRLSNLFAIPGFQADVYTRTCLVPRGKYILFPAWSYLNDYPCPDPTFEPPPGQSLEAWLTAGAREFVDRVAGLTVRIDGREVRTSSRRITTPLFSFTGDISLKPKLDGCITGKKQSGVSDGFWLMIAPPKPGEHMLEIEATSPGGNATKQSFVLRIGY
jgi:hypothetical protein